VSDASLLIVGGGLAGAAAAALIAADREVVLLERETGPHDKVCGEFISPEAQTYLTRLGLDLPALGAVTIGRLRLVADTQTSEFDLPFTALSLSRRVLDQALLEVAADRGADVRRGCRAVEITAGISGWIVRLADGAAVNTRELLLATGKHDLRGSRRPRGLHPDLVGFKQHFRLDAAASRALDGTVEIYLFEGGYAGLEPVEHGAANLCLVVERDLLRRSGGNWPSLLLALRDRMPLLSQRLENAMPTMAPLAITGIPYGYVRWRSDGIWRLGDQAAVIPSFTGDGMSIALHSAALAATMLARDPSAARFQRRLAFDVWKQMALATICSRALISRGPRKLLAAVAASYPALVSAVAHATRLPPDRLIKAG
jgi:flavin-dependent dehydrogenase